MASHNRLLETRNASMASLNREAEVPTSTSQAGGLDEVAGAETSSGREISRRGEEARGGFVLRAKSDDVPQRRRSLVERSGMKSIVQVSSKKNFFNAAQCYRIFNLRHFNRENIFGNFNDF